MQVLKIPALVLCCLCFTAGAQSPSVLVLDKPVWTLEFIKAKPGKLGLALSYLDKHWMLVREGAKQQGSVLNYYRISELGARIPDVKPGDPNSIVLLTEYKNLKAFQERENVFAPVAARLPSTPPGVMSPSNPDELYETVDTGVFTEQPAETHTPEFKLLAAQ
ncbi:MAG: hypothetical protein WBR26_17225 [Candidatus Acidiferrum sp.]